MFIPSLNVLSKTSKKIHVYDVNSLYPSVMANNDFPIGDPTYIEYPNNLILDKNLVKLHVNNINNNTIGIK